LNDQTVLCTSDPDRFIKAVSYVVRIYYGLNVDSEQNPTKKAELAEVFAVFRHQVFSQYPKMTFEQFNLVHSDSVIIKREGVSITVDELMHPIASYYAKIQFVLNERNVILREQQEEAEKERKKQAFKNESIRLYIECVKSGEWTGTPFQAMVFAKESFAHRFTQPEKDNIYTEAKQKVKELTAQQNLASIDSIAFNTPVPNDVQMFSQLIVIEACRRGLEIIVG
jgi:hypothetical protein